MKKIQLLIVITALVSSALAFAEDRASPASPARANTAPQQIADTIARQIPDTTLYKAAAIGANCATNETIRTILAGETQADKTETDADTAHNEKQTQESVNNINKCIEDGIAKMKTEMLAEKLAQ